VAGRFAPDHNEAADFIHWLFCAKRLTTSGFTRQRPFMRPSGSFPGLRVIRSLVR
jgi:hypothetical protein